jgi:carboxyl-terminal processing protease
MISNKSTRSRRFAWSAVVAAMILFSAISVSVPGAFAQQADSQAQDSKHYFQILESVFQFIEQNYVDEVTAKKLYEGAMKGMLDALGDPYSTFLDEATWNYLNDTTVVGKFGGIGLSIAKQALPANSPSDTPSYVEIFSVFDGTPGSKAGFRPGDLIIKIEGESTAPLSIDEAKNRLRGEPGTKVNLTVRRGEAEFDLAIIRAIIEIPTVKSGLIPTAKGNIAYLRIIEFSPATYARVKDAIKTFDAAGYRAMIVDLRNNPGGLLNSATQIADLFLDSGTIVSTKGRSPYENTVISAQAGLAVGKDKPIVVLINKGSASAAEILAGALKDTKRAWLVGENSYGKGSVQQIIPVDDTGFKLTMARYYTPSDENIDKTGIPPDLLSKDLVLDEAGTLALQKLADAASIEAWAKAHPKASVAERNAFAHGLAATYPALPEALLRRLVRDELARTETPPAYDLEFDTQLLDAIQAIDAPDFAAKLATAKTVKELVAAKKAAEAAAAPTTKK